MKLMFHYGVVNLPRVRRNAGRCDFRSEASRRILGLFGEFAPGNEPCCKLFAIQWSAQQMPLEREVLADRTEARQERLGTVGIAEATHAALAFTRRLMAIFGTIV